MTNDPYDTEAVPADAATGDAVPGGAATGTERRTLPIAEERLVVDKIVRGATVRVSTRTRAERVEVDEMLTCVKAQVTRVPVGKVVETVPEIEERDGVTVIPVFEEVLVRQLVLKEELHVRTVSEPKAVRETVTLRSQEPVIERLEDD